MASNILHFCIAVLAVGYVDFVIVCSGVARPLRLFVARACGYTREGSPLNWLFTKLDELLHCPFCTGFWCSVVLQVFFRINLLGTDRYSGPWFGVLGTTFAMAGMGAILAWAYGQALKHNWDADALPDEPHTRTGASQWLMRSLPCLAARGQRLRPLHPRPTRHGPP